MAIRMNKAKDLIWRRIGEETVVIKDNGMATHVLNQTAGCIWELCDGTHDVDSIADFLCERFEVNPEKASADVDAMVGRLLDIGLLQKVEG